MRKPLAVVVGFIGKLPVAGMGLYNLHYIAGLQQLGYDVHYVERQNCEDDCYDPDGNCMTSDPRGAVRHLQEQLPAIGIGAERTSFIDLRNRCHLSGWPCLRESLGRADFVLTLCDPVWFEELERCPRRVFVDGDPMFTQVEMEEGQSITAQVLKHYTTLFTYAVRMGKPNCKVPKAGREWLPARPVVATSIWNMLPPQNVAPITTVMNWASAGDVQYEATTYGHKNREMSRLIDLPQRVSQRLVLAVGGNAPKQELRDHGWELMNPLACTRTFEAYRDFITGSHADLGICKHAYVASRSGWFSDRSTCYLAAGRPVLHADTGCGDWLPTGEGVLLFSNIEDLVEAIENLNANYEQHASAARRIAEEHFEAKTIVGRMLEDAGLR